MHLVVDYEKRLRESSDSMQALEESSRKLSMEVCWILSHPLNSYKMLNPDTTFQFLGVYFKAWKRDFSEVREKIFGWSQQFVWESAPSAGFFSMSITLKFYLMASFLCFAYFTI